MFNHTAVAEQRKHWDAVYARQRAFFGAEPSAFAQETLRTFQAQGVRRLLELGPGQGRDTLFFARNHLAVTALDYSARGLAELRTLLQAQPEDPGVQLLVHDVRQPLPFQPESFDACYSHMLLCMHLSRREIALALREMHRVLRPGGLVAYSVRSVFDKHYGAGQPLGEALFAVDGFVVHFFSEPLIRELARGFTLERLDRLEEGSLPRDLYTVLLRKSAPLPEWEGVERALASDAPFVPKATPQAEATAKT